MHPADFHAGAALMVHVGRKYADPNPDQAGRQVLAIRKRRSAQGQG